MNGRWTYYEFPKGFEYYKMEVFKRVSFDMLIYHFAVRRNAILCSLMLCIAWNLEMFVCGIAFASSTFQMTVKLCISEFKVLDCCLLGCNVQCVRYVLDLVERIRYCMFMENVEEFFSFK
jgi:hypothetical protein